MRVLHVIPSVASIRGGPSKAIFEMSDSLRRHQNIQIEIVTTNDNGPDLLNVPLEQKISYQGVPVRFFSRFSPKLFSIREFAFSSGLTKWLWLNMKNYDLIHVHAIFSYPSTIAMIIARIHKIPYIVRPLGQLCEWSLQQSARKKQIYLNLIERANLNYSQAFHLTSLQEKHELSSLNLNVPTFVLPHGLSVPPIVFNARQKLREYLKLPASEPIILFLSRLHHKKGLDYLIPALSKLTHHRFTFVLAGSGSSEYEAEIESLLVSNGIRNRTHIAGFVQGEIKDLLMQGSDLFVLTSHSENFGVAVIEAFAAGLPVLVTPGVATSYIVQEHKLGYVCELNVSAIESAIEKYFTNLQQTKEMGTHGRQFILENYTWDKIATKMIEVYTSIINKDSVSLLKSITR